MSFLKRIPSWVKLVLKIAVTLLCLWYVTKKIDWALTWILLQKSDKVWLLAAMFFVAASKWVCTIRLNVYFHNIGIWLRNKEGLQLYWLGMFYNIFLPGGIGGDGYKIILLRKHYPEVPTKMVTAAVLLDRVSGVVGIGLLGVIFYAITFNFTNYSGWLLAAILPGLAVYYFGTKKIFPSFLPGFYSTFLLGVVVQLLQVFCVACIMKSVHIEGHFAEFQFLFLLSSLLAVLPFTIGGLGAREVVFIWGAAQFALDANEAVYISVLFYLMQLLISLPGMRWVYKEPLDKRELAV